jgi:hypothetical protein
VSEEVASRAVHFRLPDLMSVLSVLGFDSLETSGGTGLLYGDEPSLTLSYNEYSNKLCLTIKEDKTVVTEAQVPTFDDGEQHILFPSNFCNQVTVNAEPFVVFWKCADTSHRSSFRSVIRVPPDLESVSPSK